MHKSLNPYDLGINNLVEETQTIKIQDFIRQAQKQLKLAMVKSQIEAVGGANIELSATRTRFGGERLWFTCPGCKRRVGCLYRGANGATLGCRVCLGLIYRNQKYTKAVN
jgi:hypothetical protein